MIASQRERLQRAIVEIAAADGLAAVTVRRLTKLAGVSTASFYSRFSGTDDCLLTAYGEIMAGASRALTEARDPELGPAAQLDRALRALLGHLLADRRVARFALIEIYGGGPAAIAAAELEEGRLVSSLRGCLDRRGRRNTKDAVAAIVAGVLHCARMELIEASREERATAIDALIEWVADTLDDPDDLALPAPSSLRSPASVPSRPQQPSAPRVRDEKELIEVAILRVALRDGFGALDSRKVSSASGLSAARFRRHFKTLADGYLAAIRRTSGSFLTELTAQRDPGPVAGISIRAALQAAQRRAASDPAAARLTFRQIVEPGVAGLTCRESLISELAFACARSEDGVGASARIRAEARAAAFWDMLARSGSPRPRKSTG